MTNEDITRMAREAGMERIVAIEIDGTQTFETVRLDLLERFAALVAAEEREACARLCDALASPVHWLTAQACAEAIRERGGE